MPLQKLKVRWRIGKNAVYKRNCQLGRALRDEHILSEARKRRKRKSKKKQGGGVGGGGWEEGGEEKGKKETIVCMNDEKKGSIYRLTLERGKERGRYSDPISINGSTQREEGKVGRIDNGNLRRYTKGSAVKKCAEVPEEERSKDE